MKSNKTMPYKSQVFLLLLYKYCRGTNIKIHEVGGFVLYIYGCVAYITEG